MTLLITSHSPNADVQRHYHDAEKATAHAQLNTATQMVALYKALNSAWDAPAKSPLTPHDKH